MANWWDADQKASPLDIALDAERVDPKLADIARSVYQQESGSGKNTKTSNAGAVGGMQIIPSTFDSVADKGWDINDPVQNARAGVRYLAQLYKQAGGDPVLTAAGYYGGPGGLEKARRGIAVSDPRNPKAPTTLEYGKQVASRVLNAVVPSAQAATPASAPAANGEWWAGDSVVDPQATAPASAPAAATEEPGVLASFGASAGRGFGNAVLGAQQLIGKGLQTVGADTVGDWLVRDATEGARRLEEQARPYAQANPITSVAGEIVGAVANPLNRLVPIGGAGSLAGTALRAGAQGAISGAVTPVTQDDGNFAQNKLAQIATGGVVGTAIPVAGRLVAGGGRAIGRTARALVDPFTESGQNRIAGSVLQRFAQGGPTYGNAAEIVPGSIPTLAQATQNPGIAALERGMQSANPLAANVISDRAAANIAAREAAARGATGTAEDLATAVAERASNAADDYLKVQVGIPTSNTEYAALLQTPAMRAAFNRAQAMARNAGTTVETTVQNRATANLGGAVGRPETYVSGQGLQIMKEALDDQINKAARAGQNKQAANLLGVKERLLTLMDREIPGYADARAAYAEASRPIDAMRFLQSLNLTDASGSITLAKVQNALRNLERQRGLPGAREAKSVTEDQIATLTAIRDDLLRVAGPAGSRIPGSNTFQNLATSNILENALPGPVRALVGGTQGPVGTLAGRVGNLIYGGSNEAIQNRLMEMLMSPQSGLAALQNVGGNQLTGTLGGNALLQRLAPQLIPAGAIGANMIARPAGTNSQ